VRNLRIFTDLAPAPEVRAALMEGARGHTLLFASKPVSSVLAKADPDPQLLTADVAFGQPDPAAVESATGLKWVHISTSGITRYDNPRFRGLMAGRGVPVTNSAMVYAESCALHTMGFLLAETRNLPAALHSHTAGGTAEWHALRAASKPLRGSTVLIVGYGTIGRRLAEFLKPFGPSVLAYRRRPRGDEGVPTVSEAELPRVLAEQADHVVDILPESTDARHFFNAARFAQMKPGAVFYNIGRGGSVDQTALLEALRSGRLKTAWLDVTEPEPLPADHPLRHEPRCFITPHVAGGHAEEALTLVRHFLANLERFTKGDPLLDRVM
jgi:phosphoglycerate dehydrogenase-like enzyme